MTVRTLTDLEIGIIDFEAKHDVARLETRAVAPLLAAELGRRPVPFAQRLYRLLDDPAADRERPAEMHRRQGIWQERRAARSRPFGAPARHPNHTRRLENAG